MHNKDNGASIKPHGRSVFIVVFIPPVLPSNHVSPLTTCSPSAPAHTSPSRLFLRRCSKSVALARTPCAEVLPRTVASYPKVMTRAPGIFVCSNSSSHSVDSPAPEVCVHDLIECPLRPWTATMLSGRRMSAVCAPVMRRDWTYSTGRRIVGGGV
jgi:hypothetical protein